MSTLFTVLHIVVCVLMIVIVLLQEGKDPGMRGISGTMPDSGDTFFNKSSGRTKAAMLSKITVMFAILFLITTMVMVFLQAQ